MTRTLWLAGLTAALCTLTGCGSADYLLPAGSQPGSAQVAADQQAVDQRYSAVQFNLERAITTEESALVKDPGWADGYSRLAQLFWDANEPAAALAEAHRACDLAPHSVVDWNNLGQMAFSMHRWATAESAYKASLEQNPAGWQADVGLGQLDLARHHPTAAQSEAQAALASGGPQGPIYALYGQIEQNSGNWNAAASYYRNAIAANPQWWQGYYDMGVVDVHWGEISEAESNIRQALRDSPQSSAPWMLLQSLPQTISAQP